MNSRPFASRLSKYQGTVTVSTIRLTPGSGGQHDETAIHTNIEANHQEVVRTGAKGDVAEVTLTRDVFIFDRAITNILIDDIITWGARSFKVLNTTLEGITNIQLMVETEAMK